MLHGKRHILLNSVWKIYSLTQFWNKLNLLLHVRSGNISTCFQYMKTQQMANDGQWRETLMTAWLHPATTEMARMKWRSQVEYSKKILSRPNGSGTHDLPGASWTCYFILFIYTQVGVK